MAPSAPPRNSTPCGMTTPTRPGLGRHRGEHVLDPCEVAVAGGRHAAGGPAPRVVAPDLARPSSSG